MRAPMRLPFRFAAVAVSGEVAYLRVFDAGELGLKCLPFAIWFATKRDLRRQGAGGGGTIVASTYSGGDIGHDGQGGAGQGHTHPPPSAEKGPTPGTPPGQGEPSDWVRSRRLTGYRSRRRARGDQPRQASRTIYSVGSDAHSSYRGT
jgi:hypothetical protein